MMHALGVVHEQSRPDRDFHVKILKENIDEGKYGYEKIVKFESIIMAYHENMM